MVQFIVERKCQSEVSLLKVEWIADEIPSLTFCLCELFLGGLFSIGAPPKLGHGP